MSGSVDQSGHPRILVLSRRRLQPVVSRASAYEFEDTIARIDFTDLVAPEQVQVRTTRGLERLTRGIEKVGRVRLAPSPPLRLERLTKRYDLGFALVLGPADLKFLASVQDWRTHCRTAVCWVEEFWLRLLQYEKMLLPLRQFDHVIVSCQGTVESLSKAIERPCTYSPPGVDTLRFCPYPDRVQRVIDVYSMGRRSPDTHRRLYERAQQGDFFYLYDSATLTDFVEDTAQHRDLLASLIKRTRYFIANRAKANEPRHTVGQEEFGQRFFEGAAGGAVLIGDPPRSAAFQEYFGWHDSVIPMPYGSDKVLQLIEELDSQPQRLEAIRRRNMTECLRRHDWVYRWQSILELVGLSPAPQTVSRQQTLTQMADELCHMAAV
jgi:hypothetical protein